MNTYQAECDTIYMDMDCLLPVIDVIDEYLVAMRSFFNRAACNIDEAFYGFSQSVVRVPPDNTFNFDMTVPVANQTHYVDLAHYERECAEICPRVSWRDEILFKPPCRFCYDHTEDRPVFIPKGSTRGTVIQILDLFCMGIECDHHFFEGCVGNTNDEGWTMMCFGS